MVDGALEFIPATGTHSRRKDHDKGRWKNRRNANSGAGVKSENLWKRFALFFPGFG